MSNDARTQRWYAQPNDVIGGWCVMPVNAPPGKAGMPEIADFTERWAAEHIAELHNVWLLGPNGTRTRLASQGEG